MYKLIITDFDGSLVGKELIISKENYNAIRKMREIGVDITIATGRRWQSIEPFVKELEIKIPVILYNGAGIYDPLKDRWLERKFLEINILKEIISFLKPFYSKIYLGIYWKDELWEKNDAWNIINLIEKDLIKLFIESDIKTLLKLEDLLNSYFSNKVEIILSSENYLEILPKGCSKGRAMLTLLSYLNISPEEVIAIGDYDNDIEMLRIAKLGVTLPNASLRVRKEADYITSSGPEKALAEVVEKFILKNFLRGEDYDISDLYCKE